MTVTRMVLHNLAARTLRAGLRAGEVTATTLRVAGCAGLAGVLVVHAVPAAVVLGGGGTASLVAGVWLGRRLSRWRDAADWQPGPGPAPKRDHKRSPGRRGKAEAGAEEIAPGSLVEVVGARPSERGAWQVLSQLPTKGRGRGSAAYLVERPRTATRTGSGKPRVIDAARLVVVAPPPPAARPLAAALARGRGNARGKGGAALTDPLGRADTLQARSAALRADATTTRRRAGTVTAAATPGRQRAERGAAERASQSDQHHDRPTTRT